MPEIEIDLSHHKKQSDFVFCDDLYTAFIGGIASGKSYGGAVKSLLAAGKGKSLGMIVAPTYTMLQDVCWRAVSDMAREAIVKANTSKMTMTFKGGGEILFRSADNPERLRGSNLNWTWIDEAGSCSSGTWEIIIGRLRAGNAAGKLWVTSTPKGRNWLYRVSDSMTIFRASTMENPYLAQEYIDAITKNYHGEFARQEIYGEFVSMEGVVYPMFSRASHVTERNRADMKQFYLALDEGYTNPAVVLDIGEDSDGRLHVFQEWYEKGKLQETVVQLCKKWHEQFPRTLMAVDAAAAGLIADLKNNSLPAEPHKGRVLDGIQKVQNYLSVQEDGKPRLTIDPHCVNLINELESYVWKEGKDEPVKENDHACLIGETIICTDKGDIPLKCLRHGNMVLTRSGYRKVLVSCMTGIKEVVEITFSNGVVITGTKDHVIILNDKNIELRALRYGDIIDIYHIGGALCQKEQTKRLSKSYSTGLFLEGIPKAIGGVIKFIIPRMAYIEKIISEDCTRKFGNFITEKFQRVIISIILIITQTITQLKTLLALKHTITCPCTPIIHPGNFQEPLWMRLHYGINRTPEENFTDILEDWHTRMLNTELKYANTAGKNIARNACEKTIQNIVAIIASLPTDGKAELTANLEFAKDAGLNTRAINIQKIASVPVSVVDIKDKGTAQVYNILVEDEHEYFANGILVHNCDAMRYLINAIDSSNRHWYML
jgi:PBSX family phage terminase large subunit